MAYTSEIAHQVAELIQSEVSGFRYYKSYRQLRRPWNGIVDDIIVSVDAARGGGPPYRLSFIFGVQHRDVARIVAKALGRKLTACDRTVLQNSYNIAPKRDMRFDGKTVWHRIQDVSDLGQIKPQFCTFIQNLVLPYHERFHDLGEARRHLVANDGWVSNFAPYEQVLAIDVLQGDSVHAKEYLEGLQAKSDAGYQCNKERFNEYYTALRLDHPSVLPEFSLE